MDPLRILIVEDEMITAIDIEESLLDAGYVVGGIARNHDEAVELMKRESPDLALIDITLDGPVDGIATARNLLRHKWIPIIYLTAHSEPDTFNRAKETNPAAYLVKPFRLSELPLQIDLAIHNFYTGNLPAKVRQPDHLFLLLGKTYVRLSKSDIIFIEAERNYSRLYLTQEGLSRIYPKMKADQKLTSLTMNLGYLARHLPDNFYRLSRSLVINLDFIDRIDSEEIILKHHKIPIPTGSRKALLDRLNVIKTR
ncbi:response regulator [Larkinella soli]|uniref:response regulator n=1 Tax=Larkinella soli TaxID=1770527 RepID=UPI000FFBF9FA|nr:response regulator [Larkinella soli]